VLGRYQAARPDVPQPIVVPPTAAPVRHWADPPADLAAYRRKERALLNTYGWNDRATGVAHIPIARAMELLARRGWPASTQPAAPGEEPERTSGAAESP